MAQAFEMDTEQQQAPKMDVATALRTIMAEPNIASRLDEDRLASIGQKVIEEYEIDDESRKEWKERIEAAMELAMLVAEEKDYPFDKAANVKYPLLTVAALQFNARAYPAIVSGSDVVKCKTWGRDPQGAKAARAKRVSEHMSYQLLSQMPEWEEDTDKILVIAPIVGCVFRKVYYDPALKRTCSRLVTADRLVVNYRARSLGEAPRTTEELSLYPYEIEERIRSGRFVEFDYGAAVADLDEENEGQSAQDADSPHMFLEQHRLLDLDEDGYPEPYIVTVHKSTQKVVRIVANFDEDGVTLSDRVVSIRKRDYYIKYPFLPSPDGGFYDCGFGWLLKDIGESVNSTLNQMLDAGHLANVQGGLISSALGLREKKIRLQPGEWKTVQATGPLNQAIMPIQYPGPNATLFALLEFLLDGGREVANIKDVLTGEQQTNMPATTTLALIEQGMQVFNSIYKRIHRALKKELALHAEINAENIDPAEYSAFFDDMEEPQSGPDGQPMQPQAKTYDPAEDYSLKDMDIMPVTDPQVASRAQELARAQFLREEMQTNPLINKVEATKRILEAAQTDDTDKLIQVPEPDPLEQIMKELLLKNAVLDAAGKEADLDQKDAEVSKTEAEIAEILTSALKNIADAEAAEAGNQMGVYSAILETYKAKHAVRQKEREIGQRGLRPVAGQSRNAMGSQGGGASGQ